MHFNFVNMVSTTLQNLNIYPPFKPITCPPHYRIVIVIFGKSLQLLFNKYKMRP